MNYTKYLRSALFAITLLVTQQTLPMAPKPPNNQKHKSGIISLLTIKVSSSSKKWLAEREKFHGIGRSQRIRIFKGVTLVAWIVLTITCTVVGKRRKKLKQHKSTHRHNYSKQYAKTTHWKHS